MTATMSSSKIDSISEFLQTGRTTFDPDRVRYVCHTSTIPLATTVDEQKLLRQFPERTVEVTHSLKYQEGFDPAVDYRCCLKHCMYTRKNKSSDLEILRDNCPCGNIVRTEFMNNGEEVDYFLQPLCFIQVAKELRYKLGYTDASDCLSDGECCHKTGPFGHRSNRPRIDLADVMFCQNSQAITDSAYSRPLRNALGFSGWESCTDKGRLASVLDYLYWYRRFVSEKTKKFLDRNSENFRELKQAITQTLHTLNGQLVQKFLLFPVEMEGYRKTAELTAALFEALVRDYLKPPGDEPTPENSIFMRMKKIKKDVKQLFPSENIEVRYSIFGLITEYEGPHDPFRRFWGSCFKRLRTRSEGLDDDFTASPAFIYIMGGFSQTRNMGWLPPWVAEFRRKEFRATVGREKIQIPKDQLNLIFRLVHKQMYEAKIERGFLSVKNQSIDMEFREVINNIRIPLKPTASNNSTVSQGGKVEDARQLLSDAIGNRWRVPVRDFQTGNIKSYLQFDYGLRTKQPEYEEWIFWPALQIVLNWFGRRYKVYKDFVLELPNSLHWEERLWTMQIVHISEPGKERNLTKTSSLVAWVLTVASKVSQMVLSYHQDHRAGLVLSAQDWMHQRRVSSESYESGWLYDRQTRRRIRDCWNGFQDWTESTDYIPRRVGGVALQSWFTWIDFPRWFGDLVILMTQRDYRVTEVLGTKFENGIVEKEVYDGFVTEGFMMSMPLTKTILHLMHDINIGLVHEILRVNGVAFAPRPDDFNPDDEQTRLGPISVLPKDLE